MAGRVARGEGEEAPHRPLRRREASAAAPAGWRLVAKPGSARDGWRRRARRGHPSAGSGAVRCYEAEGLGIDIVGVLGRVSSVLLVLR